jgi:hypothetical protein
MLGYVLRTYASSFRHLVLSQKGYCYYFGYTQSTDCGVQPPFFLLQWILRRYLWFALQQVFTLWMYILVVSLHQGSFSTLGFLFVHPFGWVRHSFFPKSFSASSTLHRLS